MLRNRILHLQIYNNQHNGSIIDIKYWLGISPNCTEIPENNTSLHSILKGYEEKFLKYEKSAHKNLCIKNKRNYLK